MLAILAYIAIAIASAVLGYQIRCRRRYELIAGYKNMRPEQRKKFNIEELAKLLGLYFFTLTGFMIIGALLLWFGFPSLALVAILIPSLLLPYIFYKVRKLGLAANTQK